MLGLEKQMQIFSPHLAEKCDADCDTISFVLDRIHGCEDPFLIISESADSLHFMQTLETANGFELEYQEGSVSKHFRASSLLNRQRLEEILWDYTQGDMKWKESIEFDPIEIRDRSATLGHGLGHYIGRLICAWREFFTGIRRGFRDL